MGDIKVRRRKKHKVLGVSFTPKFWQGLDSRTFISKEIRRRYDALVEDCGAVSVQQRLLCERVVFISLQLQTMEINAAETGKLDAGVHTQMTNCLSGLLAKLGLKKLKTTIELDDYLAKKKKGGGE